MVMSEINTFMSDGTVNEDAESPELERGAWPVVAGKQRGRSGDHIGAGTRHLAAASVSVSATRACARTCDTGGRTVGAGDVQNSSRRARAIVSRRGKRHRALQGVVNVLCGAPYGY